MENDAKENYTLTKKFMLTTDTETRSNYVQAAQQLWNNPSKAYLLWGIQNDLP